MLRISSFEIGPSLRILISFSFDKSTIVEYKEGDKVPAFKIRSGFLGESLNWDLTSLIELVEGLPEILALVVV